MTIRPVARVKNDFATKFGLPRQGILADRLVSYVVMEKEFACADFLRGLDGFSHLWLLWGFDERSEKATVRPPKLGGNERRGVFATRSPFRPNPLGLSAVRLESIRADESGAVITVSGADMKNGTLVYDIKPYLPYADAIEGAKGGFAEEHVSDRLKVVFPEDMKKHLPEEKLPALLQALALDPRPSYQRDDARVYGFFYAGKDVRFRVEGDTLRVTEIAEVQIGNQD